VPDQKPGSQRNTWQPPFIPDDRPTRYFNSLLVVLQVKLWESTSTGKAAVAAHTFATPSTSNAQTVVTFGILNL
jgi:hypothetical protein